MQKWEKCFICGEPATINYQKFWVYWKYDAETDTYSEESSIGLFIQEPTDEENIHLCEKRECFEKWLGIS